MCVTRFNNTTWLENKKYREKNNMDGCIYPCPVRISCKIPIGSTIIVFEMNNETNTIMGIGVLINYLRMDKIYKIYSATPGNNNANYNRYTYQGKKYIPRDRFDEGVIEKIKTLENICFKGKAHIKRGQGIQMIPTRKLVGTDIERYFSNRLDVGKPVFT